MSKSIARVIKDCSLGVAVIVLVASVFPNIPLVQATEDTRGVPTQEECESGSTTYIWDTLDDGDPVARPVISSLSVDGEEVVDPTDPAVGTIGAAICPNVAFGRRTGLFVYMNGGSYRDMDLSEAVTPDTETTITADSEITLEIEDFGDLAEFFSFSLVHGDVTSWSTTGMGTPDATLSVTMKPVRTPFGSGEEFNFCTATPPNCTAEASQADVLSASLDMTFDQEGYGSQFRGAYFAMTGAMGGWVEARGSDGSPKTLVASLGGPHYLSDGETLNVGSLQAFIPDAAVEELFEVSSEDLSTENLEVNRVEGDESEVAPYTLEQVGGGVIVSMDEVTFSSPSYEIGLAGQDGGPDFGGNSDNSRVLEGDQVMNLMTPEGTVISDFRAIDYQDLDKTDAAYKYPLGLCSFIFSAPEGSTQEVNIAFVTDLKADEVVVRKYNSINKTYSTIDNVTVTEDRMGGYDVLLVSYQITDGGELDQDGQENGEIVDPVGLAVESVGSPNTGL